MLQPEMMARPASDQNLVDQENTSIVQLGKDEEGAIAAEDNPPDERQGKSDEVVDPSGDDVMNEEETFPEDVNLPDASDKDNVVATYKPSKDVMGISDFAQPDVTYDVTYTVESPAKAGNDDLGIQELTQKKTSERKKKARKHGKEAKKKKLPKSPAKNPPRARSDLMSSPSAVVAKETGDVGSLTRSGQKSKAKPNEDLEVMDTIGEETTVAVASIYQQETESDSDNEPLVKMKERTEAKKKESVEKAPKEKKRTTPSSKRDILGTYPNPRLEQKK